MNRPSNCYCWLEAELENPTKTTPPPIGEWCGGGVYITGFFGGAEGAKAALLPCPQTHASRCAQRGLAPGLRSQAHKGFSALPRHQTTSPRSDATRLRRINTFVNALLATSTPNNQRENYRVGPLSGKAPHAGVSPGNKKIANYIYAD